MKRFGVVVTVAATMAFAVFAQEVVRCGEGSYASYAPWRLARTFGADGDMVSGSLRGRAFFEKRGGRFENTGRFFREKSSAKKQNGILFTGRRFLQPASTDIEWDGRPLPYGSRRANISPLARRVRLPLNIRPPLLRASGMICAARRASAERAITVKRISAHAPTRG